MVSGNAAVVVVSLKIDKIISVARGNEVSVAMIWPSVASYEASEATLTHFSTYIATQVTDVVKRGGC